MVNENRDMRANSRKGPVIAGMVAVVVVVLLLIWWVVSSDEPEEQAVETPQPVEQVEPEPEVVQEPQQPAQPEPQAPAEEPAPTIQPLPELGESDEPIKEELSMLGESGEVSQVVAQDNLVRKFVRAVSALEEGALVHKYRPVNGPQSTFEAAPVEGSGGEDEPKQYRMTEENFARYDPYVNMLLQLEPADVVLLYNRYYPLLDEAFQEQGVDKGSFRDVTIGAIDSLIAAPVAGEDVLLVRPSVMYKFADPELEEMPGAHKLMMRIGPENAQKVKEKLRELRTALAE